MCLSNFNVSRDMQSRCYYEKHDVGKGAVEFLQKNSFSSFLDEVWVVAYYQNIWFHGFELH